MKNTTTGIFIVTLQFVSVLFFHSEFQCYAQSSEAYARIIDAQSRLPVSYATIQFGNTNNGIIANEDGDFRIPIDLVQNNTILIISSIGYATVKFNASQLKPDIVNTIYLKPKIEELEVVVLESKRQGKSYDFKEEAIVRKAIERIPMNYPTQKHSLIKYYRDYQIVNGNYYNLNEAILETFDNGFKWRGLATKPFQSAIYVHNLNKEFYIDSTLIQSQYGVDKRLSKSNRVALNTTTKNELELLNIHNPIRNYDVNSFSFVYEFRKDFVANHEFKLEKVVYENDEPLYEISFISNNADTSEYIGSGSIFISRNSYAIYRLDYELYSNPNFSTFGTTSTGKSNTAVDSKGNKRITYFEINLAYRLQNGKMYPSYMMFNNRFEVKENNQLELESIEFDRRQKFFLLQFNKPIDASSVNKLSNYRFKYQGNKMIINEVKLVNDYRIRVTPMWAMNYGDPMEMNLDDVEYRLKRIKDITGGVINKSKTVVGYQYREVFTQEIFESANESHDLEFINKKSPLHDAPINSVEIDENKYWVNSPLKKTVNEN